MYQIQSSHGFSWPHIDRSDGKAPIAVSGDNVYVTFADNKTGYADAYIITYNDNGKTFNPAILLTDNTNSTITNKTLMS